MCECSVFPVIDLPGTGRNIQRLRQQAGVTVRDLQTYFGFEYPQAIYKWQHGERLPSVDNLLALARVLRVPMEDLLVYDDQEVSYCVPGMARFLRVKVPPRVVTAKCSEPQAAAGNGRRGGSGVAKPRSLRTETGYEAKRWVRLQSKPKPEG